MGILLGNGGCQLDERYKKALSDTENVNITLRKKEPIARKNVFDHLAQKKEKE